MYVFMKCDCFFSRTGWTLSLEYATVVRIESDQRCGPSGESFALFVQFTRSFVQVLSFGDGAGRLIIM